MIKIVTEMMKKRDEEEEEAINAILAENRALWL